MSVFNPKQTISYLLRTLHVHLADYYCYYCPDDRHYRFAPWSFSTALGAPLRCMYERWTWISLINVVSDTKTFYNSGVIDFQNWNWREIHLRSFLFDVMLCHQERPDVRARTKYNKQKQQHPTLTTLAHHEVLVGCFVRRCGYCL